MILFAATGDIAVPLLEALAEKNLVRAVLTSPDAPGKRGKSLVPSPVKVKAEALGLEVWQPAHLRSDERKTARSLGADTLISFSYGKIFGPRFLSLFERKINVHPSLLPLYRGCAPIPAAIRNMDRETGISLQDIAEGVDEGDIYLARRISLDGTETTESLSRKVASLAPELVLDVLSSGFERRAQEGEASYTGFIGKCDGRLDFSCSAKELHARIRSCYPWPKAQAFLDDNPISITAVHGSVFDDFEDSSEAPGTIVAIDKKRGLKVATGEGYLYITRLLPAMKKEMDAVSFANGNRNLIGRQLT